MFSYCGRRDNCMHYTRGPGGGGEGSDAGLMSERPVWE